MFGDGAQQPGFVDASVQDFHLAIDSVLLDEGDPGSNYSGMLDYEEDPRLMGACTVPVLADIGADERYYPNCWCSQTQCYGDVDDNGAVNYFDVIMFNEVCQSANGNCSISSSDLAYSACVDFDHNQIVNNADWTILTQNFAQSVSPDCSVGDPF